MKISTKGRYALRLMLDLAISHSSSYVPLKEISARQGLSEKYLEQIINTLNKAGFVKSVRGAQGGYMLTRAPHDYTVGMVLRLMEGSLSPVSCLDSKPNACDRFSVCVTIEVWQRLKVAIDDVVDNITLQDLVESYYEKGSTEYVI